jgi:hypothetical protein
MMSRHCLKGLSCAVSYKIMVVVSAQLSLGLLLDDVSATDLRDYHVLLARRSWQWFLLSCH